ncbi:hypothetical protein PILCRDRAFT_15956 [Piloderma croceum F 1598]|uniref:Uncharacterized protein n=1 Tax=Piloderma croceum (strain F 1598) TaxID=765440 RepID=A0A0C3EY44_PILCF|nr:hypothetical protein PILCRDRAFT_15956 [Piloderma croceum F 1598]
MCANRRISPPPSAELDKNAQNTLYPADESRRTSNTDSAQDGPGFYLAFAFFFPALFHHPPRTHPGKNTTTTFSNEHAKHRWRKNERWEVKCVRMIWGGVRVGEEGEMGER